MLSQENHPVSTGSELSDVFVVVSDVLCFGTLDEQLLSDFDCLLFHLLSFKFNYQRYFYVISGGLRVLGNHVCSSVLRRRSFQH